MSPSFQVIISRVKPCIGVVCMEHIYKIENWVCKFDDVSIGNLLKRPAGGPFLDNITHLSPLNPIDPRDLPSKLRYFPRISPNSLKISPKFRATNHIQSLTNAHILIKRDHFLCVLEGILLALI